jgi:hypothetical protein
METSPLLSMRFTSPRSWSEGSGGLRRGDSRSSHSRFFAYGAHRPLASEERFEQGGERPRGFQVARDRVPVVEALERMEQFVEVPVQLGRPEGACPAPGDSRFRSGDLGDASGLVDGDLQVSEGRPVPLGLGSPVRPLLERRDTLDSNVQLRRRARVSTAVLSHDSVPHHDLEVMVGKRGPLSRAARAGEDDSEEVGVGAGRFQESGVGSLAGPRGTEPPRARQSRPLLR